MTDLVSRLRAWDCDSYSDCNTICVQAADRIEALEAALRFYANKESWRSSTSYMCGHGAINCNAMADKGNKARSALATNIKEG